MRCGPTNGAHGPAQMLRRTATHQSARPGATHSPASWSSGKGKSSFRLDSVGLPNARSSPVAAELPSAKILTERSTDQARNLMPAAPTGAASVRPPRLTNSPRTRRQLLDPARVPWCEDAAVTEGRQVWLVARPRRVTAPRVLRTGEAQLRCDVTSGACGPVHMNRRTATPQRARPSARSSRASRIPSKSNASPV